MAWFFRFVKFQIHHDKERYLKEDYCFGKIQQFLITVDYRYLHKTDIILKNKHAFS